jgi:dystrophin
MVWLPVLHRLSAAETATHNTKCKACKIYPIVGFRYHCLKCFNFDLCHNCFFVGRTAKGHKADHPTQEYCTSTGRTANIKILGQAIRNSFRTKKYFKKKQEKLGYLPVGSLMTGDGQEFSPTISPNISRGSEVQSSQNQSNNTVFPKPQDEHNLIAEYCQMLNEHKNDDDIDENDAEFNVRELESERKPYSPNTKI